MSVNKYQITKKKGFLSILRTEYPLYLFLIPPIILTLLFAYLPMFSNVIAFMDYNLYAGKLGLQSEWVGLHWFRQMFSDKYFWQLVWRTLFYSVIVMITGFPDSLVLALLFNEIKNKRLKKAAQTVSYLPHFVSWVTMAALTYVFLTSDVHGIFNNIMRYFFGGERVMYMADPNNFPLVLIITSIYKNIGWGTIIYLAAISALDPQLYEAAYIDGAGRWKQLIHITLPGIMPTTVMLLILTMGGLLSTNFDQIFNLQNPTIQTATSTINVYTFYAGVKGGQYSLTTAIGLFQGAVNVSMMLTVNYISKKFTDYGLF